MSELPKGWEWTTIGAVCHKPQYGWTSKSNLDGGGLPYLRTTDITKGPIDWSRVPRCQDNPPDERAFLLADGDIVVSRSGSVGASALLKSPPRAVFASYLIRLRVIRPIVPGYLRYFLQSPAYWRQISDAKVGIAVQNVNATKLAAVSLPVPPVGEQERIVAAIEEHLSRLDAAESLLTSAEQRIGLGRKILAEAAFQGAWPTVRLADVAEVRLGRQRSPARASGPRMRPYLRAANVTWAGLKLTDVKEMSFTEKESLTYELRSGDLLLSEASGSPGEVGKPAQFRGEIAGCCFQNTLIRVRLPNPMDPDFYEYFFRNEARLGRFAEGSRGVGIHHLGARAMSDWKVPLPPLDVQRSLVEVLDAQGIHLSRLLLTVRTSRARSSRLRASILAAAFSGQLVPQDPTDEPASVLLERIRAERAAATPAKRTRKAKAS